MKPLRSLALACSLAAGVGLLVPSEAAAFCGFYVAGADAKLLNNATVVVLMRDGTRTVLSMQNDYQGPPEDFALVIPVPVVLKESDVKVLREELFDRVDTLASPRLVEYWEEDPCKKPELHGTGFGRGSGAGFGGLGGGEVSKVKIEAKFKVGEYDIVVLSATESSGLDTWLRDNGYNIPAGAEPLLRPYVQQDMKFFVAKVNPKKVKFAGNGRAKLSPLRFHYDSKDFTLPVRLGLINSGGKQDLLVHILAPGVRYQLANYPNAMIPTNLDVQEMTKERFGEFYVSLFDHTLEQNPGAVVTEYAWAAGSCDPCPGPEAALTNQELLELGADVLPNWSEATSFQPAGGGTVPEVAQAEPTVEGGLDTRIVQRVVQAHLSEVRSCYNVGLAKNPTLAGRVKIDFTIADTGKVESASVAETTLGETKVGECLAKVIGRWTFPPPDAGKVLVSYPFDLTPPPPGGWGGSSNAFVLTRLHARYDASGLAEDLVFEAASPVTGGRETGDRLEQGAKIVEGGQNNFQARYAIRHEWPGEVTCDKPIRGRWGGPAPDDADKHPKLARQLSDTTRGAVLGSFVTASASQQLGIGVAAVIEPPTKDPDEKVVEKAPTPSEPKDPAASKPAAPASGCACSSESQPGLPGGAASLALLALLGLTRRGDRR